MSAITHLITGVPVSDLDAGIDWYTSRAVRSVLASAGRVVGEEQSVGVEGPGRQRRADPPPGR